MCKKYTHSHLLAGVVTGASAGVGVGTSALPGVVTGASAGVGVCTSALAGVVTGASAGVGVSRTSPVSNSTPRRSLELLILSELVYKLLFYSTDLQARNGNADFLF